MDAFVCSLFPYTAPPLRQNLGLNLGLPRSDASCYNEPMRND